MSKFFLFIAGVLVSILLAGCAHNQTYTENFDLLEDRTWVNNDYLTIPIEDWEITEGKVKCIGDRTNMKAVLLKYLLQPEGDFLLNVRMGLTKLDGETGSGGVVIGMQDKTDMSIKSLAYFGQGLNVGVDTEGYLFIGEITKALPENFDISDFTLHVDGYKSGNNATVRVQATDENGISTEVLTKKDIISFEGAISVIQNHASGKMYTGQCEFWFDDISLRGSAVFEQQENAFGPILWAMYTLSKDVLKLSAQMPPLGTKDNQYVELHFDQEGEWVINQSVKIDANSRVALFRVENWNSAKDTKYQIRYTQKYKDGQEETFTYDGRIRKDPVNKTLKLGGLTCQYHYGFPYKPLVENLDKSNPDLLYFSGDQLYEGNGGYPIKRFPAEMAIKSYLGKWYMFGWAFGDIMRDRPTITIPDDHDIFQGNLWGAGGQNIPEKEFRKTHGTSGGYVEPFEMVQAVHYSQCAHLPDPFDPSPMDQGIIPYYTELLYGRVSFAIVGDRMFKSGPNEVSSWEGRQDHIKTKLKDMSKIDPPGLKFLGDRQMNFLKFWAQNWTGADMKCLLSQTIFSNVATHHGGNKGVLFADLDSGAWPMTPRNRTVDIMRSCFSFHVAGDQHLPSLIQYGTEDFRDGGWAFCTPAIAVGYQRRFQPEKIGWAISNRPEHNLPNTGNYRDPFGHPTYVYAVGNPEDDTRDPNRYIKAQKCSSGFGMISFDTQERTILCDAYRFYADLSDSKNPENQFPGWPLSITQLENNGKKIAGYLQEIELNKEEEFIQLYNEKSGEFVYALRPKNNLFKPMIYSKGSYTLRVINEKTNETRQLTGLSAVQ